VRGVQGVRARGGARCTLTPPDPQLKGAWYPGGFNPCAYQADNRFQNVPFKCNLRRYTVVYDVERQYGSKAGLYSR
jgi:hypothetical protein